MKTIQMTIDEHLLREVDKTIEDLQMTRSAFIRLALESALHLYRVRRLEERDAKGYEAYPAAPGDTDEWLAEQAWEEQWNEER